MRATLTRTALQRYHGEVESSADGSTRRAQYPCVTGPGWCEKSTSYPVQMIESATQWASH